MAQNYRRDKGQCVKLLDSGSSDAQLPLEAGEASGRTFPLTTMVSQRGLCCTRHTYRVKVLTPGTKVFLFPGHKRAVEDSWKQRHRREGAATFFLAYLDCVCLAWLLIQFNPNKAVPWGGGLCLKTSRVNLQLG